MADDNPVADSADEPKVVAEADSTAHFEPLVKLERINVVTGEEDENVDYKERARLYRFDSSTKEWKERGTGDVKFLVHKETGRARILLRQEKTLKLCVNHLEMELKQNMGSDRAWTWTSIDYSDPDDVKVFSFAIKFKTPEVANEFKAAYDKCRKINAAPGKAAADSKESDELWFQYVKDRKFAPLKSEDVKAIWAKHDKSNSNSVDASDLSKLLGDVMNAAIAAASTPLTDSQKDQLRKCLPTWTVRAGKSLGPKFSLAEFEALPDVKALLVQ